jgi:hypothetical protein
MGDMLLLAALLLAMGPDPGGHTGDTVTPNTTRTGQPVENGQPTKPQGEESTKGKPSAPPPQDGGATSSQGNPRR